MEQTQHFTESVETFTAEIPYRLQTAMCSFIDKLAKSCSSKCELDRCPFFSGRVRSWHHFL